MNVTAKIDRVDGDKFRKVDDAKLHSVGGVIAGVIVTRYDGTNHNANMVIHIRRKHETDISGERILG